MTGIPVGALFVAFVLWLNWIGWKETKRRRELTPKEQERLRKEEEDWMRDYSL